MKPFVFRPQVVLDRALDAEARLMRQLASVQHELARADDEIHQVREMRAATMRAITEMPRHCGIETLMQQRMHLEALATTLTTLQCTRAQIQLRLDDARNALCEAMRQRQALEKLRDARQDAYRKEVEKQELRQMEEMMLPHIARERAGRVI